MTKSKLQKENGKKHEGLNMLPEKKKKLVNEDLREKIGKYLETNENGNAFSSVQFSSVAQSCPTL